MGRHTIENESFKQQFINCWNNLMYKGGVIDDDLRRIANEVDPNLGKELIAERRWLLYDFSEIISSLDKLFQRKKNRLSVLKYWDKLIKKGGLEKHMLEKGFVVYTRNYDLIKPSWYQTTTGKLMMSALFDEI